MNCCGVRLLGSSGCGLSLQERKILSVCWEWGGGCWISGNLYRGLTLDVFTLPVCLARNPLPLPKGQWVAHLLEWWRKEPQFCMWTLPVISQGTNSTSVTTYWNDGIHWRKCHGKKGDEVVAHQQVHFVFLYVVGILDGSLLPECEKSWIIWRQETLSWSCSNLRTCCHNCLLWLYTKNEWRTFLHWWN